MTLTSITPRNRFNGIAEKSFTVHNQHGELVLNNVTQAVV